MVGRGHRDTSHFDGLKQKPNALDRVKIGLQAQGARGQLEVLANQKQRHRLDTAGRRPTDK